jgi:hypothetical protein
MLDDKDHQEVVIHGEQSCRCTLPKNLIACLSRAGSQGSEVPEAYSRKLCACRSLR